MKTILTIEQDFSSYDSFYMFKEDINYLVSELNIFCEIKNNSFDNFIEDEKRYFSHKKDYKNKVVVDAVGYSQCEWQTYVIYFNENEIKTSEEKLNFQYLQKKLKKSFTHFNDYFCTLIERTEINGKIFNSEPFDTAFFSIRHIEFPEDSEIIKEYNSIYGKNYDKVIVKNL